MLRRTVKEQEARSKKLKKLQLILNHLVREDIGQHAPEIVYWNPAHVINQSAMALPSSTTLTAINIFAQHHYSGFDLLGLRLLDSLRGQDLPDHHFSARHALTQARLQETHI